MDVARASGVVSALAAARAPGGGGDAIAQARRIKNDAVGNASAKRAYVAAKAVPELASLVASPVSPPPLVAEALAALCSLCVRNDVGVQALLATPSALDGLLAALHAPSRPVAHAAARALKVLATSPHVTPLALDAVAARPLALAQLVALAGDAGPVCAAAAAVLAAVVRNPKHAAAARAAGILPALIPALRPRAHPERTRAAIDALGALATADPDSARDIAAAGAPRASLPFVRAAADPALRLAACRLLARLRRARALVERREAADVADAVVPQLNSLLNNGRVDVRVAVPDVLAEMVVDDKDMQQRAIDEGAISRLASFFPRDPTRPPRDARAPETPRGIELDPELQWLPMAEAAMNALAALCQELDEARAQIVNAGLWPHIVHYFASEHRSAALAAARCLRSLTRSVKVLRRDVGSAKLNELADIIVRHLRGDDLEMRQCVSAALCNVVIDFCPLQPVFLDKGGSALLASLLRADDALLRKNALWAVKNLLFKADLDVKSRVMADISFETLIELCVEPSPEVRELAMNVVRNLACFGSAAQETQHLDMLFVCMGTRLLEVVERALQPGSSSDVSEDDRVKIAVQALYTVCNIASGTEEHKVRLIESDIPRLILQWISHQNERARIAAVWCTINLSRKDRPPPRPPAQPTSPPQRMSIPRTRRAYSSTRLARRRSTRLNMVLQNHMLLPRTGLSRAALDDEQSLLPIVVSPSQRDPDDMVLDSDGDTVDARSVPASNTQPAPSSTDTPMLEVVPANDAISVAGAAPSSTGRREEGVGVDEMDTTAPSSKREGHEWRIEKLRELGFEGKLRQLVDDPHVEVQGRARAALEQFSISDINTLDYCPRSLLTRANQSQLRARAAVSHVTAVRMARITAAPNVSDESSAGSESSTLTAVEDAINNAMPS